MDERAMRAFRREIETQCDVVALASEFLRHAIEHGPGPRDDPQAMLWMPIQAILVSAANISRLCFGEGRKKQRARLAEERAPLRQLLAVGDDSPIAEQRMPAVFSRLDERLEELAESEDGADLEPRRFDPLTWVAQLLGESLSIRAVVEEAARLRAILGELEAARD
jgi:hypothetical protein